jgi:hypothetical protein
MSQAVTFKFTPDQNDYAKALRIFFLRQTGIRISLVFLVVAFGIILYTVLWQTTPVSILQIVWLLLPPIFVVYTLYYQPRNMAKRAMANEQLAAESTWEVGEDGVDMSTSFGSIHFSWEDIKKLITSQEYYLVLFKTDKNFFRFIPRRAFTTTQDQEQFLQLMTSHLGQ